MQITAVLHTVRVVFVVPAIELCNFIPAVQHGEALQKRHGSVQQQVALHGIIQCDLIVLFQCLLDTAQAGGGAAAPGIAGGGVVVVQLALCPAAGEIALVEVVPMWLR